MGQKFIITETERNQIRGLYEQDNTTNQPTERVFNIVKVMFALKASGTITFTNDMIKCNFNYGKQDFIGEVHIDKKMVSGTVETFICSGEFFGSDKHIFTIMPSNKAIMWEANNPVDGKMRPGVTLSYK
jgi:hypothetical protein